MRYNLTPSQKELGRWLVGEVEEGRLKEEFGIVWTAASTGLIPGYKGESSRGDSLITEGNIRALAHEDLLHISARSKTSILSVNIS